ncbi:hypothetical protein D9613_011068 [Agrocybe pediades]|uniref:Uncharacterized protein n=1 Tax=Agrocybe pediades TaxID=84607 RepID=A0A8H4QKZ6_9AGAR|nr:hypothetical protein D9613_011068 [Agrocybe pediades]
MALMMFNVQLLVIVDYRPGIQSRILNEEFVVDSEICDLEIMDRWSAFEETAVWPAHEQNYTDICNCDAIIFVYTIGSPNSLEDAARVHHVSLSTRRKDQAESVFLLVGNKCDLEDRETPLDEGILVADRWGCDYIETSAKTGKNVEEMFAIVVRRLRLAKKEKALAEEKSRKRHRKSNSGCIIA